MKEKISLLVLLLLALPKAVAAQEMYVEASEEGKTLTFYYDNQKNSRWGKIFTDRSGWEAAKELATKVVFDASMADFRPTSTADWFWQFSELTTIEGLKNLNTSEVTDMSYMFSGCEKLTELDVSAFNTSKVTSMSFMFQGCAKLASLNLTHFDTSNVTDMSHMFNYCESLTSLDVTYFYTGNVTNMAAMFIDCHNLTSLDVTHFDTRNVEDMAYMFEGCYKLTTPDLSRFNTSKVTDMAGMFKNCHGLEWLDLTTFDTSKVKNMSSMFEGCDGLTVLDVTNFDTRQVTNMSSMFMGCWRLTELDLMNFITTNVTKMKEMFRNCSQLATIYSRRNWRKTMDADNMFYGCKRLMGGSGTAYDPEITGKEYAHPDHFSDRGYFTDTKPYVVYTDEDHTLTFYFDYNLREGEVIDFAPTDIAHHHKWNTEEMQKTVERVVFAKSFAKCIPHETNYWFQDFSNLKTIEGWENLNTSHVSSMRGMFWGIGDIKLDLSHFDTGNVTDMGCMFEKSKVERLDLSSFDTGNVTDMEHMFDECSELLWLDLTGFDVSKVEEMTYMFWGCEKLGTIYCGSDWSQSPAALKDKAGSLFVHCRSLSGGNGTTYDPEHQIDYARPDLDGQPAYFTIKPAWAVYYSESQTLKFYYEDGVYAGTMMDFDIVWNGQAFHKWNTKDMQQNVKHVEFDKSFAQYRPQDLKFWFQDFSQLEDVKGLEYLNTSEVTDMTNLFTNCSSLSEIDLTNFDMSACRNITAMFYGCTSLTTIYCNDDWSAYPSLTFISNANSVFNECTSLVGGMGTTLDTDHLDESYARPDGGTDAPGYFTRFIPTDMSDASHLNDKGQMINDNHGGVYDLQGRRLDGVGAGPVPARLRKGIYIENGRKVLVRDKR